jgi:hypothetical protein
MYRNPASRRSDENKENEDPAVSDVEREFLMSHVVENEHQHARPQLLNTISYLRGKLASAENLARHNHQKFQKQQKDLKYLTHEHR